MVKKENKMINVNLNMQNSQGTLYLHTYIYKHTHTHTFIYHVTMLEMQDSMLIANHQSITIDNIIHTFDLTKAV